MGYLDDAASLPALRAALAQLRDEILSGTYRPRPARQVQIPKPGGGCRRLAVGCVRDRVVQHAVAATLSAALDRTLHDFAYAYRRGRSPHQAISAERALASGKEWGLRGDIEEFFDRIPIGW